MTVSTSDERYVHACSQVVLPKTKAMVISRSDEAFDRGLADATAHRDTLRAQLLGLAHVDPA